MAVFRPDAEYEVPSTGHAVANDPIARAVELLRDLPERYSSCFGRIADEFVQGAVDARYADAAHATPVSLRWMGR